LPSADKGIGIIYEACKAHGYVLFVTADHGNAEQMISPTGGPHTAHTCNPVPLVMTSKKLTFGRKEGALCDVAPTVLEAMGLPIPEEMTGKSMLGH
jgi:2,3-bisphosphoglycerate-independent phosphoglycerate mutase